MDKHGLLTSITAASIFLLIQSPLSAGVYKWTDENGQVHYGEQPGSASAEQVPIRHNETTTPRAIKKPEDAEDKKTDGSTEKEAEEWEEWQEVQPSKKEKNKLCKEAKSDLEAISGRGRMREINDKGEYVRLTEDERQQRVADAKKKKQKYCR